MRRLAVLNVKAAPALLANWFDLADGHEQLFDLWHNREHMIERLNIPGFVRGRRLISIDQPADQGNGYLVLYDAESLAVLESPAYGERLESPTEMTRANVPALRSLTRTAYSIAVIKGRSGLGTFVQTIRPRLDPDPSILEDKTIQELANDIYSISAITSMQLCSPDAAVSNFKEKTKEGRTTETCVHASYPWCFLVEASRGQALVEANLAIREFTSMGWNRARPVALDTHSYRGVFSMTKSDLEDL
jgi:hypothetical protein